MKPENVVQYDAVYRHFGLIKCCSLDNLYLLFQILNSWDWRVEHKNRTGDNKFNMSLCIDILCNIALFNRQLLPVVSDPKLPGLEDKT